MQLVKSFRLLLLTMVAAVALTGLMTSTAAAVPHTAPTQQNEDGSSNRSNCAAEAMRLEQATNDLNNALRYYQDTLSIRRKLISNGGAQDSVAAYANTQAALNRYYSALREYEAADAAWDACRRGY